MALPDEDFGLLSDLIEDHGYTAVLDAMSDIARENIKEWRAQGGHRDAIDAIVSDLKRTVRALHRAAIDARG
jgi:hypothetical protein